MTKRKRDRKGKGISVDLSGVETGQKTIPEGTYAVAVSNATLETSDNSGNKYIKMEFEVTDGKHKGSKLWHNCSLQPQALFNLKSVLLALGFEIPKKAFDLETEDLIGLECEVEVSHEIYEGKKKSKITEFINPEDDDEDDEDDEDTDYEDMSLAELKAECKERGITFSKKAKEKDLIALLEEDDE